MMLNLLRLRNLGYTQLQGNPKNAWNWWESTPPATQNANFGGCATKLWNLAVKYYIEKPMLLNLVNLLQYFVEGCLRKYMIVSNSTKTPLNLHLQYIFVFQMTHSLFKFYLAQPSCHKDLNLIYFKKHCFAL